MEAGLQTIHCNYQIILFNKLRTFHISIFHLNILSTRKLRDSLSVSSETVFESFESKLSIWLSRWILEQILAQIGAGEKKNEKYEIHMNKG